MAELTGFQTASQSEIEIASKSNSLTRGSSPFLNGIAFAVEGFTFKKVEIDGKVPADARPQPVLLTSIGGDLFVKRINREATQGVVKGDGSVYMPTGTFNLFVRDTLADPANKGKADGELLQLIVDGCKGKTLLVERFSYSAKYPDGRPYATSFVNINFKVD